MLGLVHDRAGIIHQLVAFKHNAKNEQRQRAELHDWNVSEDFKGGAFCF